MILFKILCIIYLIKNSKCDERTINLMELIPHKIGGVHQKHECPFQKKENVLPLSVQNAADICQPQRKQCDPSNVYYTADGSCNNLEIPHWGQAGTAFTRLLQANYSDGIYKFRTSVDGSSLPLSRIIRTTILPIGHTPAKHINILFYSFGQFVDHDVSNQESQNSAEKCCVDGKPASIQLEDVCLPTIIPENDPFYSQFKVTCLDLKRAINTKSVGCSLEPISQINFQTAFMDLSFIYGRNEESLRKLRAFEGGLLKFSEGNFPPIIENCPSGGIKPDSGSSCFLSGDNRLNENPELFSIDVIFHRFHNYIAINLKKLNNKAEDELLFQESRRISVAMYQHILTAEYLPNLIGMQSAQMFKLLPLSTGYSNGYDPKVNPQTLESYTAAAGRASHSTVVGSVTYLNSENEKEAYLLRDKYFNLEFLLKKNIFLNMMKAYGFQTCKRQDEQFTEEINNWLFAVNNASFGQDLSSIDINRGRDFGLPAYNQFREACGLCKLHQFNDFASEIRNPEDVEKLKQVYKNIDDIDLYVGGLLEKPLSGGTVGPTFACILGESFFRWKFGDRFFYEFPSAKFTIAQLQVIRSITFSGILCITNPSLTEFSKNGFLVPSPQNPMVSCDKLSKIDFSPWK